MAILILQIAIVLHLGYQWMGQADFSALLPEIFLFIFTAIAKNYFTQQQQLIQHLKKYIIQLELNQSHAADPLAPSPVKIPDEPSDAIANYPVPATDFATSTPPVSDVTALTPVDHSFSNRSPQQPIEPMQPSISVANDIGELNPHSTGNRLISQIVAWFKGGNSIVRIAVVVLLVGVILLLRFASEQWQLSLATQLLGVASGGVALIALGIHLRKKRLQYAISVQAAGLAILYLVLFSGFYLKVLPHLGTTYALLIVLLGVTLWFAVWQDALFLAFIALGSGFIAPFIVNQGEPHVVGLMAFYLLLNIGIAGIAWFKAWRILNGTALLMTYPIAGSFIWFHATPQHHLAITLWIWSIFALYLFVAVRYSQVIQQQLMPFNRDDLKLQFKALPPLDTTILFANPFMAFSLFAAIVHSNQTQLAIASAALAAIYAGIGYALHRNTGHLSLLVQCFYGLALVFAALVLPFAYGAYWSSVGWAVNGLAMIYLGTRMRLKLATLWGCCLLVMAAISTWLTDDSLNTVKQVFAYTILMVSYVAAAYSLILRYSSIISTSLQSTSFIPVGYRIFIGYLMSISFGLSPLVFNDVFDKLHMNAVSSVLSALLLWQFILHVVLTGLKTRYASSLQFATLELYWERWGWGVLGLTFIGFVLYKIDDVTPWRLMAISVLWLMNYVYQIVQRQQSSRNLHRISGITLTYADGLNIGMTAQLMSPLMCIMLGGLIGVWFSGSNALVYWGVLPLVFIAVTQFYSPLQVLKPLWQSHLGGFALGCVWLLAVSVLHDGQWQGRYIPLLNPADLLSIVIFTLLVVIARAHTRVTWVTRLGLVLLSLGIVLISSILMRALVRWQSLDYWSLAALNNATIQTALTILWASTALVLTLVASRKVWRALWMMGIAILVLVIAKLVLLDLSHTHTLTRIISFIGSGLIMLVIGYFAPLPPAASSSNRAANSSDNE